MKCRNMENKQVNLILYKLERHKSLVHQILKTHRKIKSKTMITNMTLKTENINKYLLNVKKQLILNFSLIRGFGVLGFSLSLQPQPQPPGFNLSLQPQSQCPGFNLSLQPQSQPPGSTSATRLQSKPPAIFLIMKV